MEFCYGLVPIDRSVVRWPLGDFRKRLADAQKGDSWASPLFVRDGHLDGQRVLFYLTLQPGLKADDANAKEKAPPSKLLLHTLGPADHRPKEDVLCSVWIENSSGVVSAKNEKTLEFPFDKAGVAWDAFLTAAQLDALKDEEALTVCARLPFDSTVLRMDDAAFTHKCDFGFMDDIMDDMRGDGVHVDSREFRLLPDGPLFEVDFDFGWTETADWKLSLALREASKYAGVYLRYSLWLEDGDENARTAKREGFLYVTKDEQFRRPTTYTLAEYSAVPAGNPINVCCCVTAVRIEPLSAELDGLKLLQKQLEKAMENDEYADFSFKSTSGEEFKVPSYLFALHSEQFRNQVDPRTKKRPQFFVLEGKDEPRHVRQLIAFLYTGQVERLEKSAHYVYRLAHRYGVTDLEQMCVISMCRELTVKTFFYTSSHAWKSTGSEEVRDFCVRFALAKAAEIRKQAGWQKFVDRHPRVVAALKKRGFKLD